MIVHYCQLRAVVVWFGRALGGRCGVLRALPKRGNTVSNLRNGIVAAGCGLLLGTAAIAVAAGVDDSDDARGPAPLFPVATIPTDERTTGVSMTDDAQSKAIVAADARLTALRSRAGGSRLVLRGPLIDSATQQPIGTVYTVVFDRPIALDDLVPQMRATNLKALRATGVEQLDVTVDLRTKEVTDVQLARSGEVPNPAPSDEPSRDGIDPPTPGQSPASTPAATEEGAR